MIHLCYNPKLRQTIYSPNFAQCFREQGISAQCHRIGSVRFAELVDALVPKRVRPRIESLCLTPLWNRQWLNSLRADDIVWIYTNGLIVSRIGRDAALERAVKSRGARYVFHLPDAWPKQADLTLRNACDIRVRLADLTAPVTPQLEQHIRDSYGDVALATCEEAIDVDAFEPKDLVQDFSKKIVVWTGPAGQKHDVMRLLPIFEDVYRKVPFTFRIISDTKRPNWDIPISWEWLPFPGEQLGKGYQDALVAVAYYSNRETYGHCKGNYKIKTHMAAGKAIVTSPVGYNQMLIADGVNGLLASSHEEWVNALCRVLTDEALAKRLGKAARDDAVTRFSYIPIARQYIQTLDRFFPREMEKARG